LKNGIEVGNYSNSLSLSTKMKDAVFTDEQGKKQPYTWELWFGLAPHPHNRV